MRGDDNFQRIGSISNSHVGADFESVVQAYWHQQGVSLVPNYPLQIGQTGRAPKIRKFDLGSHSPNIIAECKIA